MNVKTKLSKKTSYDEQSLYAYCSCSCGDCGCPGVNNNPGVITVGNHSATQNASMTSVAGRPRSL